MGGWIGIEGRWVRLRFGGRWGREIVCETGFNFERGCLGCCRGGVCPILRQWLQSGREGLCLLLLVLILVPLAVARSAPRNGNTEQIVAATFTCQQLIKGLSQEPRRFSLVEISGNVTCINEDWKKVETLKIKTDLIIRGKHLIATKVLSQGIISPIESMNVI